MPSLSTPGEKVALQTWLVELVMTRANKGRKLPPKFWNDLKYRGRFRREIQGLNKGLKEYGQTAVIRATWNNFLDTFTDYQKFTFLLQCEMERLKRLSLPKDFSPVEIENIQPPPDLRIKTSNMASHQGGKKFKHSVFEKLANLENGDSNGQEES